MSPDPLGDPRSIEIHDSYAVVIGDHAVQINNYGANTWSYAGAKDPLADDSGVIGSPYRGLSVFEASDAALFFGRDAAIAQVTERMARCMETTGMLAVSGVSGAGKSSLLRAGVLPMMQRQGLPSVPLAAAWPRVLFTPTAQPLNELAVRVASLARTDAALVRSGLGTDPGLFSLTARQAVVTQMTGIAGGRLLLVIDQFEQLFTQCEDAAERRAFIAALHAAASGMAAPGLGKEASGAAAPPGALVVLGVRADFEARCADYPELAGPIQDRYLLTAMTEAELRAAITGPAGRAAARVEDSLVRHLLDEMRTHLAAPGQEVVTGAGALPLLSHALDQTWRNHSGDSLTLVDYRQSGGIEGAVAASAQRAYERLTSAEQATARQVFLRLTATSPDGTDTAVRVTRAELEEGQDPAAVRAVFDAFAAEHLLALDSDAAEICHEALLTAWPLFRDNWLAETRADRVVRTRLRDAAGEWAAHGRDSAYLYRGMVLESAWMVAGRVTADPQRHGAMNQTENAFLRASLRAARRRRRQLQGFAALLGVLVLVLAGATVAAVQAGRQTARQRDKAVSAELAALSEAPSTNPVQARLDAVAAWRLDPSSSQARYAMQNAAMLPEIASLGGPPAGQDIIAFSPGGSLLGVADATAFGTLDVLQIWNAETHSLVSSFRVSGTVTALSFGAVGRLLAVGTLNGGTQLWNTRTVRKVATLYQPGDTGHLENVSAVTFNPAGTVLAVGYQISPLDNADGVQLWRVNASDPADSTPLGAPFPPPDVQSLAFSAGGGTLAIGAGIGSSGTILWSVAGHREIGSVAPGTTDDGVAFSPDATTVAVASRTKLQLWNARSRRLVATLIPKYGSEISPDVDFSPDGAALAVVEGGEVQFWQVAFRKQVGRTIGNGILGPLVSSAIFSPNGATIALSMNTGTQLWSSSGLTGKPQEVLGTSNVNNSVGAMSFAPHGTLLAVGDSNTVRLWDPVTGKPSGGPLARNTGFYGAQASFSPDGRYLAMATGGGTVKLLDTRTRTAAALDVSSGRQSGDLVAFSPGSALLAVGTDPVTFGTVGTDRPSVVELWDAATRRLVATLPAGRATNVDSLAFSPDGSTLAVLTDNGSTLDLWNVRTRQLHGSFTPAGSGAYTVAWSPDGTALAIGSGVGVQLWNVASRTQDGSPLPSGPANALAWSPDGSILAVGSTTGTELWNVAARQQIGSTLITSNSQTVAWSPDGKTLAVGMSDGTVQIWNLAGLRAAGTPAYLCAQAGAGQTITRAQWAQDAPGVAYQDVCPSRIG
jgi:WD40 repeat protein